MAKKEVMNMEERLNEPSEEELEEKRSAAREKIAKEWGIDIVEEGQIIVVHSLSQALLASEAKYPFEIQGLKPLDEQLAERGL